MYILGVSVHIQRLAVNLKLSLFINVRRINSCWESFTIFSIKIFRRCLTFDAVFMFISYASYLWPEILQNKFRAFALLVTFSV